MNSGLPIDCLPGIFRWIDDDYTTLYNASLVSRGWSLVGVSHLYRDPWSLVPHDITCDQESKLRIAMLLRTHLSCADPNVFNTEERLRISKIDAICIPPVDYLTKVYLFLQRLMVQISTISNEHTDQSKKSIATYSDSSYDEHKPLYPYLSLARAVNLVKLQESLRFVNANPNPLWCYDYTMEEALVDQKITQQLWSVFRNRNLNTIRKFVWKGIIPLEDIFLGKISLSGLRELELRWKYDPTGSPCTQDINFKTLFQSTRNLRRLRLHLDPWVEKIDDNDIADLISMQEPGSLKSLHIEGAHKPLTKTIDALLTHHQHSLRELHIVDYIPSNSGLEKIGQFSSLKSLKFHDCFNLNDREFFAILQACKNLRELHLRKLPNVSSLAVRKIIEIAGSNLRKLVISQIGVEVLDVEAVHSLVRYAKNLKHLDIQKMTFPPAEMCQFIENTPQLEYVALGEPIGNTPTSGDLIIQSVMGNCPRLKYLNASELMITGKSLKDLTEHPTLKNIALPVFVS
ncbi:hypothetical protein K7432_008940 [Basidiobolus ranarum]|uniref:RNI-like protein n=1 Tax=Basidiobolus ranarum TaxID=34480 RepID=A0ABR2VXT8_9FUNG